MVDGKIVSSDTSGICVTKTILGIMIIVLHLMMMIIIITIVHAFIHSFSILSDDRFKASSKTDYST